MYRISPSLIGMLLECHRCLWLHFREGMKRPSGPFPSLPGGMDEMFKAYFDEHRAAGTLPPEIDGKVDGTLFSDRRKLDVWRNNWKGLRAEFPEFSLELKGAIDDLIVQEDGKVTPFDFKTRGYPTKEDTHLHYQHQLNLYALLLDQNGMESSGRGYLLFFWPTAYNLGAAQFATQVIKMTAEAEQGRALLEKVSGILAADIPAMHSTCAFCLFRESAGKEAEPKPASLFE